MTAQPPAHGDATAPDPAPAPLPPQGPAGAFTTGSTLRHVLVMTATGSIGLVSIFIVDFLNLFYISLLGEQELAAAIGYAGSLLFLMTSFGIGVTIGITAVVSRSLGARERPRARRLAASGCVLMVLVMSVLALAAMASVGPLVTLLGAGGRTHELAVRFLLMTLPSSPFLGLGMALAGILRSVGDARRAMWVTLAGGLIAAAADPLFIFGLGLGLDGAAIATNLSRLALGVVGLHGAVRVHDLVARPLVSDSLHDMGAIGRIAGPAVLTNIATPVANGYLTAALAGYGDAAVAAWAVIGRLVPVAFGAVFALTGAVGPIIGQNQGALRFDRVRDTLSNSLAAVTAYVVAVSLLLLLAQDALIVMFAVTGEAAELIRYYCRFVAVTFVFVGWLFVANAGFNVLGAPLYATAFNWGRATLGTVPFAMVGASLAGARGVLLGMGLGGALFGVLAVIVVYRTVDAAARRAGPP